MSIEIVNLQPHEVVVIPSVGAAPIRFPSKGQVQVRMQVEDVTPNGIIKKGTWTHTRNLPPMEENTLFIVSSLVAQFELYKNDRTDLLFPWGLMRNEHGKVVGCKALCSPRK